MPALEDVTLAREAFSNADDVEQESLLLPSLLRYWGSGVLF